MVFKACAYKGCENYLMDSMDCGKRHFTLFRFPKEPRRRQLWMELGQVSSKIPVHHLHMCSEHFDKKFISVNSRCTLLIGQAVPYPYEEPTSCEDATTTVADSAIMETSGILYVEDGDDEEGEEVEITETLEFEDDMDYKVESTTMRNEYTIHNTEQDEPEDNALFDVGLLDTYEESENTGILEKVALASSAQANVKKRQAPTPAATPTPSQPPGKTQNEANTATAAKQKKMMPAPNAEGVRRLSRVSGAESALKSRDSSPSTVRSEPESKVEFGDGSIVTTFIFRGEEYVQMPRDFYLREKAQLARKVVHYEKLLRNFKQQLDAVNFND